MQFSNKIICVNITKELKRRPNVYEAARKYWALKRPDFQTSEYVFAVYKGKVWAVFKPLYWFQTDNEKYKGRWKFEGEEIKDSPYLNLPIRMYGPVLYINI